MESHTQRMIQNGEEGNIPYLPPSLSSAFLSLPFFLLNGCATPKILIINIKRNGKGTHFSCAEFLSTLRKPSIFFSPLGEHTRGINYISFLLISTRLAQCLLDSSPLPFIIFLLLQCLSLVHCFPSVPQGSLFSPSLFIFSVS